MEKHPIIWAEAHSISDWGFQIADFGSERVCERGAAPEEHFKKTILCALCVFAVKNILAVVFEFLATVAEFVAGQIEQQGGFALVAVGQFEGVFKIGFFNAFDDRC